MSEYKKLTPAEYCAFKLVRLCASPRDYTQYGPFAGDNDADNTPYCKILKSLENKGFVKLSITPCGRYGKIKILEAA